MWRALHVALSFLTTLPLPPVMNWQEDDPRRGVRAYPLVGLVLGALLAPAFVVLESLPDMLRGSLLLGVWLLLTGALHFDGFCDTADAAFSSKPPEERQKIAKDPSLGAFALAAGGTLLLVKASALGALPHWGALLVIPILSRTLVVLPMALAEVHGSSHLGRAARIGPREVLLPLSLGLGLSAGLALLLGLEGYLRLLLVALFGVLLLSLWLSARMGGLSGDAYGALIEASEALMLVVAVW